MVFLKEFLEKDDFEKKSDAQKACNFQVGIEFMCMKKGAVILIYETIS